MKKRSLLLSLLVAGVAVAMASCTGQPEGEKKDDESSVVESKADESKADESKADESKADEPSEESSETPAAKEIDDFYMFKSSKPKTEYQVGDAFTTENIDLGIDYTDGTDDEVDIADCTVKIVNAENTEVTAEAAMAAKGAYKVVITYEGTDIEVTYNINVIGVQKTFSYTYTPTVGIAADETALDNEYAKIVGVKATSSTEEKAITYNGKDYTIGLKVKDEGNNCVAVTPTQDCKLTVVWSADKAGLGAVCTATGEEKQLGKTAQESDLTNKIAYETTFTLKKGVTYNVQGSGSSGSTYLFDFIFDYSFDEDTVVDNVNIAISDYATEFTTKGDTQFNAAAPQGLVVTAYNNYGFPTVLAADEYSVAISEKGSTEQVTAITKSGTYTIYISVNGDAEDQSYDITVTNPDAIITGITVNSTDAKVKFYEGDTFNANNIVVTATDEEGNNKTVEAADYTVILVKNDVEATKFDASTSETVKYEVVVSYAGQIDKYVVEYYAINKYEIDTTDVKTTVALGTKVSDYKVAAKTMVVFDDGTMKDTGEVPVVNGVYTNGDFTGETDFNTAGTVFIAFESPLYGVVTQKYVDVAKVSELSFTPADGECMLTKDSDPLTNEIIDPTETGLIEIVGTVVGRVYNKDTNLSLKYIETGKIKDGQSTGAFKIVVTQKSVVTFKNVQPGNKDATKGCANVGLFTDLTCATLATATLNGADNALHQAVGDGTSVNATDLVYVVEAGTYYFATQETARGFRITGFTITEWKAE